MIEDFEVQDLDEFQLCYVCYLALNPEEHIQSKGLD